MAQETALSTCRCGRPLRVEDPHVYQFVTTRTLGEHFWLHPVLTSDLMPACRKAQRALKAQRTQLDARIRLHVDRVNKRQPNAPRPLTVEDFKRSAASLIPSALARAQAATGAGDSEPVEIYAVVVMSNHIHLVVRAPGSNLALFMAVFKKRLADGINRLLGRSGSLFSRRYDAQPILNDDALRERIGYTLANPRKAGLVDDHQQWPGFIAAAGMLDSPDKSRCETEYFDATAWHRAGAPEQSDAYWRQISLVFNRAPDDGQSPNEDYLEDVRAWARDVKWAAKKQKRVIGLKRVLDADFNERPKDPARSRRPYAFGTSDEKTRLRAAIDLITKAYAKCMDRWLGGIDLQQLQWPPGTYPPGMPLAA